MIALSPIPKSATWSGIKGAVLSTLRRSRQTGTVRVIAQKCPACRIKAAARAAAKAAKAAQAAKAAAGDTSEDKDAASGDGNSSGAAVTAGDESKTAPAAEPAPCTCGQVAFLVVLSGSVKSGGDLVATLHGTKSAGEVRGTACFGVALRGMGCCSWSCSRRDLTPFRCAARHAALPVAEAPLSPPVARRAGGVHGGPLEVRAMPRRAARQQWAGVRGCRRDDCAAVWCWCWCVSEQGPEERAGCRPHHCGRRARRELDSRQARCPRWGARPPPAAVQACARRRRRYGRWCCARCTPAACVPKHWP